MIPRTAALPPSWEQATVGDVAEVCLGKMLDGGKRTEGTRLPYLRNINVRWGHFDLSDLLEMPFEVHELERYEVRPGDLMVCEGGEPGRCAIWKDQGFNVKYQKALHRVRVQPNLSCRWLMYHLLHDANNGSLDKHFTGTTIKHFTRVSLINYPIKISPLPEQKRIVAKLDELTERSRRAREALDAIPPLLQKFRQSVLAAAFRGDLTADWRAAHPDVEPASELLVRIRQERRRRWEELEIEKMRLKRSPTNEGVSRAKYRQPHCADGQQLALPAGWCWATIDELAFVGTGTTPRRSDPSFWLGGTVPWVTSAAANQDLVTSPSELVTEKALRDTNLTLYPPGSLIVAMYGEGQTRGRCAELGIEAAINQALAALVTSGFSDHIRDWIRWFMEYNYEQLRLQASGGVQPNVNLEIVRKIEVPLAPLTEQAVILAKLSALMGQFLNLLGASQGQSVRLQELQQSILAKAFRGELVPQDPNDEPASVLLERIRAERAASANQAASQKSAGRKRRERTVDSCT